VVVITTRNVPSKKKKNGEWQLVEFEGTVFIVRAKAKNKILKQDSNNTTPREGTFVF
jgi:hypothetical protein